MKNKILSILCIFILLSFLFINNNVFAASYDLSDYKNVDLKNGSWVIFRDLDTNDIYMLTTSNTDYPYISQDGYIDDPGGNWLCSKYVPKNHSYLAGTLIYLFNSDTNTFNYYTNGGISTGTYFNVGPVELIASGIDIYNHDGTVVFQQTPVPSVVTTTQTVLAEKLEKVEMKEPIMTTIVGLAKLLIPFLVCLIAFWKAWRLLSKILHKS